MYLKSALVLSFQRRGNFHLAIIRRNYTWRATNSASNDTMIFLLRIIIVIPLVVVAGLLVFFFLDPFFASSLSQKDRELQLLDGSSSAVNAIDVRRKPGHIDLFVL